MGPDAMILVFWVLSFKPIFSLSCFTVIKRLFSRVHYVLCAEYIMWNAGLDESQAGIKIARRNNNLRYADDTILMAEMEEELKSLLMKVEEKSEKGGLPLSIQKTKIMASGSITSWQTDGKKWKQ